MLRIVRGRWSRLARLFGDDIFISYRRTRASRYAAALAEKLTTLDYAAYLDRYDTEAARDVPDKVLRKLRNATMLVVVATNDVDAPIPSAARSRRFWRRSVPSSSSMWTER